MSCRFSFSARFSLGSGAVIEVATRTKSVITEAYMVDFMVEDL